MLLDSIPPGCRVFFLLFITIFFKRNIGYYNDYQFTIHTFYRLSFYYYYYYYYYYYLRVGSLHISFFCVFLLRNMNLRGRDLIFRGSFFFLSVEGWGVG